MFGGVQMFCEHNSLETKTSMRFAVFEPPQARHSPVPVLWFLSGLTCSEENFTLKAGAQRAAAELGLFLVVPDTSPRGPWAPTSEDGSVELGWGAGFYVDATNEPWRQHYRMRSYVERELPALIGSSFPADLSRQGIMGHSMGGHGAITIALRNEDVFRSVSALAPIASPANCAWGKKAFTEYLGADQEAWEEYDSCALIRQGKRAREILVDQGTEDPFLENQLQLHLLERACNEAGVRLTIFYRAGYDHSYFFVATFIEEHLKWHAAQLHNSTEYKRPSKFSDD
jgi:S-formylglutathione hydrolase